MLRRLDLRGLAGGDLVAALPAPGAGGDLPRAAVVSIIDEVKKRGDAALFELTERFDGARLESLRVPAKEVHEALCLVPRELEAALEVARAGIEDLYRLELREGARLVSDGLSVSELRIPVERAGLYAPGGRARYPSSVLMTAVPARVAGVGELVLCVPPGPDGRIAVETLAAAALAGVDEVYAIGGAQAIAAMAYGTESVRRVDVIAGPGNLYVSLAKREVSGDVGVPSAFAGPSEVVVIADGEADPACAAIDVVVQAEHGPAGLAWLVTWSEELAAAVGEEVSRIVEASPRRREIGSTLETGGYCVVVDGPVEAMEVSNAIAPEHLELQVAEPEPLVAMVRNAGAVFVGRWSPASVGDYVAGPSHVLPTYRSARFSSALGVDDFVKRVHVIELTEAGLRRLGPHVEAIATAEGLYAHAESVGARWPGSPVGARWPGSPGETGRPA
ncbi:MAG: histidinol dehydrogenase [Acidimicrobiales bacterium]